MTVFDELYCEILAPPEVQVIVRAWSGPMPQRATAILHNHYVEVSDAFNVRGAVEVIAFLGLKAVRH